MKTANDPRKSSRKMNAISYSDSIGDNVDHFLKGIADNIKLFIY
jgi:hypothetical protein